MTKRPWWMYIVLGLCFVFCLTASDCEWTGGKTSDDTQRIEQEKILNEGTRETGQPNITNFREKKLLKQIYEMRDQENLVTYSYIQSEYSGKLIYIGKSIGYPIPCATQYTNPLKVEDPQWHDSAVIAQADPNGLFSPQSANGTWVMLINSVDNKPRVTYWECNVICSPFPLTYALQ